MIAVSDVLSKSSEFKTIKTKLTSIFRKGHSEFEVLCSFREKYY